MNLYLNIIENSISSSSQKVFNFEMCSTSRDVQFIDEFKLTGPTVKDHNDAINRLRII